MTPELPPNVAVRPITERMVVIRGQNVILDSNLAAVYGVPTKRLNEQVRRHAERFPPACRTSSPRLAR